MSEYVAYCRGDWIPASEVRLPLSDRAVTVADTVYDVTRTFNGTPFRLEQHVDRLRRSLAYVRIDPQLPRSKLIDLALEAVDRNKAQLDSARDFTIWHIVSRGPGREVTKAGPPTIIVRVVPIDFGYHARYYRTGVSTVIARTRNLAPDMVDPKVKHFSRMHFTLASLEAADIDPSAWALLLDRNGNVSEGIGYNVFVVNGGVIRSPLADNILEGESYQVVFELAAKLGIPIERSNLQPFDLYRADEAFVTATSFCAVPVARTDGRTPQLGVPGPTYGRLMEAWNELAGLNIIGQATEWLDAQPAAPPQGDASRP